MEDPHAGISRRDLVRQGGAAVTAFTIVGPQTVRGSQANSKISVGLIGTGGRGTYDAGIFNADPRARVTALCDLYDDRIEKGTQAIKAQRPAVFKDFEKLLASPVDAVIIATPPFEHPRMLAAAEAGPLDGFQSARAALVRGHAALVSAYGNEAAPLLREAARRLEPFDLSLARRAYMTAWSAAVTAGYLGGADDLVEISRAVRALPPLSADPHPLDLALEAFALLSTEGYAVATPVLRRAAKAVLVSSRWKWLSLIMKMNRP